MRAKRPVAHSCFSLLTACVLVAALWMTSVAGMVHAGTAPPTRSPGAAISPDPSSAEAVNAASAIALVSQTIELVVEPPPTVTTDAEVGAVGDLAQDDRRVRAQVNSSFVLRNAGRSVVALNLGFPLNDSSGIKDGQGNLPVVEGVEVNVGGVPASYTLTARTNPYGEGEPAIQWATFPAVLPAREDIAVGATYTSVAAGQWPVAQFNYAFETASAWRGRIGDSEIALRLPFTATAENVFLSDSTAGSVFDGPDVRWSRRNVAGSAQNNFQVTILAPKIWQQILVAREAVQVTPDLTDAWVTLGRAYRSAILVDNGVAQGGTRQFVPLAEQAYEKAIALNPSVAEVHQEYAQLVYDLRIAEDLNTAQALPQLEKVIGNVQTALQLDPENPATADLLLQVKQLVQDLAVRQPSAEATALVDQIGAIEAMLVFSAPAATATPVPESTVVATDTIAIPEPAAITGAQVGTGVGVVPTLSVEQAGAMLAAQSTVAAATVLTATPSAEEAAAVAEAIAIISARETVVAQGAAQAGVLNAIPTLGVEEESAVLAAQSTVAAATVLTTTPSAPEATAIAGAVATVGARETVVAQMAVGNVAPAEETAVAETPIAEPVMVTVEATADAALAVDTPAAISTTAAAAVATDTPAGLASEPQTLVARLGLLSVVGIACVVIVVLGILAALLIAAFGRRRAARSAARARGRDGKPPNSG